MKIILSLFLSLSLVCLQEGMAQTSSSENALDSNKNVNLFVDARVDVLVSKHKDVKLGVIRSGKGYRVQIYSGNNRSKANEIKIDFMRRFPGIRTYLTYSSPQYRVKAGDFHDRKDAQNLFNQVYKIYKPVMIVPDIIVINTLKDD